MSSDESTPFTDHHQQVRSDEATVGPQFSAQETDRVTDIHPLSVSADRTRTVLPDALIEAIEEIVDRRIRTFIRSASALPVRLIRHE
jgi:hypothetical protein